MTRDLAALGRERFDVLVIGGGIVGCGIARDAALRGLRTALVEREDFAAGTSSRTSKLAHGGLRYLEHGHVGLVREACRERERLVRAAPHLVRPLGFLLPHERGDGWPALPLLRAGLWLYDRFAGPSRSGHHRMLPAAELPRREPALAGRALRGGALYYDAQMDDVRVTLEAALGAAEAGAVVLNHAEVVRFGAAGGGALGRAAIRDGLTGTLHQAEARLFINACGPWGDAVLRLAGREGPPVLRPTKGIHLVYGEPLVRQALILRARRDRRVFFALPWQGLTLLGTTDSDFAGDPGAPRVEAEEARYLLEEAAAALPGVQLDPAKVLSAFAGVRPLLAGPPGHPSAASREHVIREEMPGLLSVLGGKFTTFRAIAEEAVDRIQERLGSPRTPCPTRDAPLPGGVPFSLGGTRAPETPAWQRLLGAYGARAARVLDRARVIPDGLEPLCPHTWHVKGEVLHAVREEMAVTLEDVLERRLGLRHATACRGACAAEPAARLAATLLGWSEAERDRQAEAWRALAATPPVGG